MAWGLEHGNETTAQSLTLTGHGDEGRDDSRKGECRNILLSDYNLKGSSSEL